MENIEVQQEPQKPNRIFDNSIYENLPPLLKGLTDLFEGREKDIALLSNIGILSSCLPNIYGIYDGNSVASNLYIMIIAPPASGKGVMNYSRLLVTPIHNRVYSESHGENQECQDEKFLNKNKGSKDKDKQNEESAQVECPPIETKIIPANISSAEIYTTIKYAHYGGVIIESEADTLSTMLNQDWGNFSDVLRKAFHHEPLSISRKTDNFYLEIERPQLSLVLSGTPDQLKPLVKSRDNGLFSRLMFYYFDEVADWKDVFQDDLRNIKGEYDAAGKVVFSFYGKLLELNNPVEFLLTDQQKARFNEEMKRIYDIVVIAHPLSFTSNVKRHGLIFFRLCMILTGFRLGEEIVDLKEIICSDEDFNTAIRLTNQLLHHANTVSNNVSLEFLSENDENFLYSLKETFTRAEAIARGKDYGISERSVDEKLAKWRKGKFLQKVTHGTYKRVLK